MSTDELREIAIAAGASDALVIPATNVVVEEIVALRCQYGCGEYGQWLTCPPYAPTPERTRKILSEYKRCVLIAMDMSTDPNAQMDDEDMANPKEARLSATTDAVLFRGPARRFFRLVVGVERQLFLTGYYRAFGFAAGHCPFCETCNLERPCRFPALVRPSMEACGIDVFATLRNSGWSNHVYTDPSQPFRIYGLVLVD